MPTLADPTSWKNKHYAYRGYLYIHKPRVILTGQINMPPNTFSYPVFQLKVKNGVLSGDIASGMLVLLGTAPGRDNLGRSFALFGNELGLHIRFESEALSRGGGIHIVNDSYVTVLDVFIPYAKGVYGNINRDWVTPLDINPSMKG